MDRERRSTMTQGRSPRHDGENESRAGTNRDRETSMRRETSSLPSIWERSAWGPSPFDMMRRYTEEMGRMFDQWGRGLGDFRFGAWPAIEMLDRERELVLRAELPGMRREDVQLRLSGNRLMIEGERRDENEQKGDRYHTTEWTYGRFSRQIALPEGVDADRMTARMQNGVLEVTIPYDHRHGAREIPIEGRESQKSESNR